MLLKRLTAHERESDKLDQGGKLLLSRVELGPSGNEYNYDNTIMTNISYVF